MTTKLMLSLAAIVATSGLAATMNQNDFTLNAAVMAGFNLAYEGDRDWAVFTDVAGAPAQCLQNQRLAAGREQSWGGPNGKVRVDFGTFDSAGAAMSAAQEAALMLNNATARLTGSDVIGDASWRTEVGSPTFIVQTGTVVFYVSAQTLSATQVKKIATLIAREAAKFQKPESAAQIACDVETYVGLKLMKPNARITELVGRLSASNKAEVLGQLKQVVQALDSSDVDASAKANLLRTLNNAQ